MWCIPRASGLSQNYKMVYPTHTWYMWCIPRASGLSQNYKWSIPRTSGLSQKNVGRKSGLSLISKLVFITFLYTYAYSYTSTLPMWYTNVIVGISSSEWPWIYHLERKNACFVFRWSIPCFGIDHSCTEKIVSVQKWSNLKMTILNKLLHLVTWNFHRM